MPKRRSIIAYNISVVAKSTNDIRSDSVTVKSIFKRNVANLVCFLKTYGMSQDQLLQRVTINKSPCFEQSMQSPAGAILCLSYMGNWEILTKIIPLIGPPEKKFGAIYRPLDAKAADHYVATKRKEYNCQMFPKSTAMSTFSTFLRQGGVLGILADQRSGRPKANNRKFFGQDSARSKLPAVMHLRTQAPLFSLSVYSTAAGRWNVDILPINLPDKKLSTDEVVGQITASYERDFSAHLLDVFWMHRYWK